jgi:hypothetical protein
MRFFGSRRRLAAAAMLAVLAAGLAAVYAQFNSSGGAAGPSTGAAGSVARVQATTVGPLTPQLNPADTTPITVTVDNAGPSGAYLGAISGAVRSEGGCLGAWFSVAPVASPGTVGSGEHSYASSVILNDNDRNQTGCLSRKLTIDWTIAGASATSP